MLNKELAALWQESLEDEDFRFELKAQEVAVRLANAVAASGMTQKELADKLGWKTSRMSKVLHGASNLTLKTLVQVSEALDIDFDIHFGGINHLNKQVEVIQRTQIHAEAMLKEAERLNRLSWEKAGRYQKLTKVAYNTGSLLEVAGR